MQLAVFVTDDGSPHGSGPMLFVEDPSSSDLPANPRSLGWRYFATIDEDDVLFMPERPRGLSALEEDGFYISDRLF